MSNLGAPIQQEMIEKQSQGKGDSLLMATLACFYFFSILIVILKPKDTFVMWYAKHGVVYSCAAIFFWIMSYFGWLAFVGLVGEIGVLGLVLLSSSKAMSGEKLIIPVVTDLSGKIGLERLTDILQKNK